MKARKDRSGSEHGIYQAYKLALYLYALQKLSNTILLQREREYFPITGS